MERSLIVEFENRLNDLIIDILTKDDLPGIKLYFEDETLYDYIKDILRDVE